MSTAATQSATTTTTLTAVAMIAFAANSLLCRQALGASTIDAASFAAIRTVAGALTLAGILAARGEIKLAIQGHWRTASMLFTYVVFFSFAYLSLSAGTGALILFGAVQLTMFVVALRSGETFSPLSWVGFAFAIAGLVYLVSPGVTAPDLVGAILMAGAGVAWGLYSLLGRGAASPLVATGGAFIAATPAIIVVSLIALAAGEAHVTGAGVVLAIASGAIASGLGYVVWYAALRGLTATRAAIVQLSVPVIAAFGGVSFLAEELSLRLIFASIAILGGVTIVLTRRESARRGH